MGSGEHGATRFVPRVEGLEDRSVPAGNVQVMLFHGTLYVSGDDAGNQIEIAGVKTDRVRIRALDATTTINGGRGEIRVKGITRDLYVRMHGGDDNLIVTGTSNRGTLNVDMGDGNDILGVSGVGHRGATILATGAGDDTAILNGFVARRYLFLDTGAGNDQVVARNVGAVDFGLLNPAGNDFFDNQNSTFARPAIVGFTSGTRPPTATPATPTTDPTTTPTTEPTATTPDTTPPTATVSTAAANPTRATPIAFAVNFNEDVTGFDPTDPADLLVTNGIVTSFTTFDARTFALQVMPSAQGAVSVAVAAGAATDAAKNGNLASNAVALTFDSLAPAVATNALVTSDTTPTLTGMVSEPAVVRVTVNGKTYTATVTGGTWSADVTDVVPNGTFPVTATATDPAGNVGNATPVDLKVDNTPPTIVFSSTPTVPTNQSPVTVRITFSENVTGFDTDDISVSNGVKTNFQATPGNPRVYTVDVTPVFEGNVTVIVPADAARDVANNPSEGLNFIFLYDTTPPMVAVNAGPGTTGAITGTSSDTAGASGVRAVEVSIRNGAAGLFYTGPSTGFDSVAEVFLPVATTDNFATWSFTLATGMYVPGSMPVVNAKATDNAGNVAFDSRTVTVT